MIDEDQIVDEIIREIDYDIYKDIKNMEEEECEQSDTRIAIKVLLSKYLEGRRG